MPYLEPTQESGATFVRRGLAGPIVMLNLLRLREQADYSGSPSLAPEQPVSGAEAYRRYEEHTTPFLAAAGGQVLFRGEGGPALIGPLEERWDLVLLVRHPDARTFLSFADNREYLAGLGHRTAALADSRVVPLTATAANFDGGRVI